MAMLSGTPALSVRQLPGGRYDHRFFLVMIVTLTVLMVAGFARTYFFAGLFRARLPGLLIHVHAVVFTCWFILLLVQSALATSGRVDLHRRLGIAGVVVAGLMIPIGLTTTAEFIRRVASSSPRIRIAAIMPIAELTAFAVLATAAFLARRRPDVHKRLILLATVGLIPAATGRMEFLPLFHFHGPNALRLVWAYTYALLLPLGAYDLWSRRGLHPATMWGGAFSRRLAPNGTLDLHYSRLDWLRTLAGVLGSLNLV